MENIFDRLQFVKGLNPNREDGIFNTREDAVDYVLDKQLSDRPTVVAEPIVLRYDSNSASKGPNVILGIGSVGVGTPTSANRTFFIDTQKTEEEIAELDEKIEQAIKSLTIVPIDSDTIDLTAEKTDDGTILSGDVKIADYRITSGKVDYNIIETEGDKGIFAFVDMEYDSDTSVITFRTTKATKEFQLPPDQHVVRGWYDTSKEEIVLKLADGTKVEIDVVKLIDEWTVLPDGKTIRGYNVSGQTVYYTPIALYKTHVSSSTEVHDGIYVWQDILEADIKVADHISDNILHKDRTGRYLYVKGTADNIKYDGNITVKDAIDSIDTRVSTSAGNLIYKRPDGIYATAMLGYNAAENKIKYSYSDGASGELKEIEFKLNSVKFLEDITYDPTKEVIVIRYIDSQGEYQRVEIPAKDIIEEWAVNNEAHNIFLNKYRSQGQGKDILSADAKIHNGDNNILEDLNHELYVNGISNNIKYDVTGDTTVKNVLDELKDKDIELEDKLDAEIADRTHDVNVINNTIGSGFTSDPHENITFKFNELNLKVDSEIERSIYKDDELTDALNNEITRSTEKDVEHDAKISEIQTTIGSGFSTNETETITYKFEHLTEKVNEESEKLQNEIDRSIEKDTEHDGKIETIENEIGDGFGPRNTVRDEIDKLQENIDNVSEDASLRLTDVLNEDGSINVETRNDSNGKPTIKVVSTNLSSEIEDDKENIIKLNSDGLYAGVDLIYEFSEETGSNKLIFKTTNATKVYDLKTNSVVDKIYYDPTREAIIIEYTVNGHRMPDVVIPVGDLIDEWRVDDGHDGAIQLEKIRVASGTPEQDILKASVVITETHDDNILVNDSGALYVSGQGIIDNANEINALKERMASAEDDIDALEEGLTNEIIRATNEEQRIEGKLDDEISRSTAKDDELQNHINDLTTTIHNEINRAVSVENGIISDLNDEIHRAISAETALQTSINNEITRATNEEQRIETKLDNEISRSTAKDNELQNQINTVESDLSDEISRATNAENLLNSNLTAETNRATSAETAIQTSISNEITRATNEEQRIETKLDNEISRSTAKDDELQIQINGLNTYLNNEISRAEGAENSIRESLTEEIERAKTSEREITNSLSSEVDRATAQEEYLLHLINDETERRISGDTINSNAIAAEEIRARDKETELQTLINNEISRAQNSESTLRDSITAETLRAQEADNELYQKIADETSARATKDADLESKINQEISRAQVSENTISEALQSEITRSTNEDNRLNNAITSETVARQAADNELEDAIRRATLTFDDTSSIDFTKTTGNVVTADVKLQDGNNIIKCGQGLYASVDLSYDPGTNKIKLVTSNGDGTEIQLVGASLLEDLYYDTTNKELVITYKDATGVEHTVRFGVSELFNEWSINNPSEKSAVELTKTHSVEPGGEDKLSGRVLITDDRDGDGKPDPGSDNIIEIRNNGLYVNGSAFSAATATTECVKQELNAIERAIFGNQYISECGEGFVYEAPNGSIYINSAVTVNNATFILDQSIKRLSSYTEIVDNKVDIVSGIAECNKAELKVVENNILGMPLLNECGNGDTYRPNEGTNYIFSGTSFNNTDIILDREIKKSNDKIDILNQRVDNVEIDVDCISGSTASLYKLLYGQGTSIPECGAGATYQPYVGSCIISGATSFNEADRMLNDQICSMISMWVSGVTPSSSSYWDEQGLNRLLKVDVRLSHGNTNGMTDEEFITSTQNGDYIEPTRNEFTDTNVLRLVHISEGPDGIPLPDDTPYNGLYVSNVWDCGLYYDEVEDAQAKADAQAAGYKTNYSTDSSEGTMNYNYMNNVRQNDI